MTPHIESKLTDISPLVIMPGDPKRVEYIANNYLNDAYLVNSVRGELAYTGYYKGKRKNVFYPFFALPFQKRRLRIHQDGKDEDRNPQYVQNIRDGALIGYKYFDLSHTSRVFLNLKGKFKGKISIRFEEKWKDLYSVDVNTKGKGRICISFNSEDKKKALYFHFEGKGRLDFYSFILE